MKPLRAKLATVCAFVLLATLSVAFAQNRSLPADGGYIDVKTDFGANGDGVADDTASIQAAILEVLKDNDHYNIGTPHNRD